MLIHAIENSLGAALSPLILVLGHHADKIQEQVLNFPLKVAINKNYLSGMASSIITGLAHLQAAENQYNTVSGALFLLADQPLLTVNTIKAVAQKGSASPGKIIIPVFNGKRGNPVYFDNCFFNAMKQLTGDTGGRVLFDRYAHAVQELPVEDPGICLDIDTPDNYDMLSQKESR